jgi:hypothetical protein
VTPTVLSHLATGSPSCEANDPYPPPGQTTIAGVGPTAPAGVWTAIVGTSAGSLPDADGAPSGQRGWSRVGSFSPAPGFSRFVRSRMFAGGPADRFCAKALTK